MGRRTPSGVIVNKDSLLSAGIDVNCVVADAKPGHDLEAIGSFKGRSRNTNRV